MTQTQKARVEQDWSNIAGEPITVEKTGGVIYGFGSELGCLRLEHKMRCGRANFSTNLNTWYYANE